MPESSNNLGGRPTDFKEEYIRQAYILCRDDGYTIAKLAKLFKRHRSTIHNWMNSIPEFKAAIRKGRDEYDRENVENALNRRAVGFKYNEAHKMAVWFDGPDPKPRKKPLPTRTVIRDGKAIEQYQKFVTVKRIRKEVAPDGRSCEFWLCNRNPERWKKLKHVELTGKDGEALFNEPLLKAFLAEITDAKGPEYVETLKKRLIADASNSSK